MQPKETDSRQAYKNKPKKRFVTMPKGAQVVREYKLSTDITCGGVLCMNTETLALKEGPEPQESINWERNRDTICYHYNKTNFTLLITGYNLHMGHCE